ncbi:transposase domain-containing protein [Megasphaera cerevisiae]|uniref:transposase domain-containing protein n=1 Tax=Megasphaera cerevisiae TaxID=39029 RepID=UPI001F35A2B9|nr:transposase domain-containing protein [Megasphaera cerevisiae]MCI1750239.1 transposase domain-containing protein [Megasphaera cerevisiae]
MNWLTDWKFILLLNMAVGWIKASAAVYDIIETCKANQINPENYLLYLFQHLPNETKFPDRDVLDRYMPWNPEI